MRTIASTPVLTIVDPDMAAGHPEDKALAPAKPLFRTVELQAQGPNLPVGIMVNGQRSRPFRLRPFRLKEEKEISKLKQEGKAMTMGKFVMQVLSKMLVTCGPHNFDQMKESERQLVIANLTMADVLYIYLYLRYDALGADEPVGMRITCVSCNGDYNWYGDLRTIEVQVADDAAPLERDFELRDGIQMRGEMRRKLKLGPLVWSSFIALSAGDMTEKATNIIMSSIVGVEGIDQNPFLMSKNEMDEMTKYDVNALQAEIDDHTPGPKLLIEPECPHCKYKQRAQLDWGWDSFFSRSARGIRTKS